MQFFTDAAVNLPDKFPDFIPNMYSKCLLPGSNQVFSPKTWGHVFTQQLPSTDLEYEQHEFWCEDEEGAVLQPYAKKPVLLMHFMTSGHVRFKLNGFGNGEIFSGQYMLFYIPASKQHKIWIPKGHTQSRHFNLSVDIIKELAEKYSELQSLVAHADQQHPEGLHLLPARINSDVDQILKEVMNCPVDPIERKYYLKARLLNLLLLYVYNMGQYKQQGFMIGTTVFNSADIEILHQAKEILLANEGAPFTTTVISRQVGLNTAKLKMGFRYLFDTTIFRLQQSRRMQRGAELLNSSTESIDAIAAILYFNHRNGFIKAFRKQFNCTPHQYRMRKR